MWWRGFNEQIGWGNIAKATNRKGGTTPFLVSGGSFLGGLAGEKRGQSSLPHQRGGVRVLPFTNLARVWCSSRYLLDSDSESSFSFTYFHHWLSWSLSVWTSNGTTISPTPRSSFALLRQLSKVGFMAKLSWEGQWDCNGVFIIRTSSFPSLETYLNFKALKSTKYLCNLPSAKLGCILD